MPCHAMPRCVFLTVPYVHSLAAATPFSSRSVPSPHPQHPHPHVEPVGYPSFPVGEVWNQLCLEKALPCGAALICQLPLARASELDRGWLV